MLFSFLEEELLSDCELRPCLVVGLSCIFLLSNDEFAELFSLDLLPGGFFR